MSFDGKGLVKSNGWRIEARGFTKGSQFVSEKAHRDVVDEEEVLLVVLCRRWREWLEGEHLGDNRRVIIISQLLLCGHVLRFGLWDASTS